MLQLSFLANPLIQSLNTLLICVSFVTFFVWIPTAEILFWQVFCDFIEYFQAIFGIVLLNNPRPISFGLLLHNHNTSMLLCNFMFEFPCIIS